MESDKMKGSMEVLNSFQMTKGMEGLDHASKELYKNKEVLAVILKGVAREFEGYHYKEIMGFIEGDSITTDEDVSLGRTNTRIIGDDKEYGALNEKLALFDTKFRVVNPELSGGEVIVNLHVDVEAQKTYRPGYSIEKRGIYYLARELSSQLSLVIIRLGDKIFHEIEDKGKNDMMEFLHAVMYPHRENFLDTIKKYINFSENEELWKEVGKMSGLGMSILEEGRIEGRIEGRAEEIIESGYDFGMSEQDILARLQKKLQITLEEAERYLETFGKQPV